MEDIFENDLDTDLPESNLCFGSDSPSESSNEGNEAEKPLAAGGALDEADKEAYQRFAHIQKS